MLVNALNYAVIGPELTERKQLMIPACVLKDGRLSNGSLPWLSLSSSCRGKLAFPHLHTEGKETLRVTEGTRDIPKYTIRFMNKYDAKSGGGCSCALPFENGITC